MPRKSTKGYRKKSTTSKSRKTKAKPEFSKRDILKFIQELRNKNDNQEE